MPKGYKKDGNYAGKVFKIGEHPSKDTEFQKGNIPWSKGKKCPEISERQKGKHLSFNTEFKIGHKNGFLKGYTPWNWNPNREEVIKNQRNDGEYQQWVKQVKKRDNNQCVFKGQNCSGYNIVHHILPWRDYPELRYEVKNGITLCQYHHPRKKVDEQRLIPFFEKMVMSKELI